MNLILLDDADFIDSGRVLLSGRRHAHITAVLRASVGDALQLGRLGGCRGSGRILRLGAVDVELAVNLQQPPPSPLPITLLLALPRPKVLRRVLQGVTAMGIKTIVLLNSSRVDKSYWQSPFLHPAALRDQLLLGLEQSGDTILPEIQLRRRFKPFVEDELPGRVRGCRALVAHPAALSPCPASPPGDLLLAVGPEGGFIPYEIERLSAAGCEPVHFGRRPLRVETALPALLGRLATLPPASA